ncbi:MAG: DMT family transporter [Thermoleophilaceae bacterium]
MDRPPAILLMVVAGGLIALQAPINAMLGRSVGTFAAASVSFAIGTLALVAITVLIGGGFGDLGQAGSLSWYYLTGGVLGAVYVTSALATVATLGAGGVTAATITGQLVTAVVADRLGVLGLEQRELSAGRIAGVALLAVGTYLVVRE